MAHLLVSDLSSAYFAPEISDLTFEIPNGSPSRRLLDATLHIPTGDMSDGSFQIPIAANASNLLTEDELLCGTNDTLASPVHPHLPRQDLLTLSQLTPITHRYASSHREVDTPVTTLRKTRNITSKSKPRIAPAHKDPKAPSISAVHNSPSRPKGKRAFDASVQKGVRGADSGPFGPNASRIAQLKSEVENLMSVPLEDDLPTPSVSESWSPYFTTL
jgi:hypothetical protein